MANAERPFDPARDGAVEVLMTRARSAAARTARALDGACADLTLADDRLDERTLIGARALLIEVVMVTAAAIRDRAARRLDKNGDAAMAHLLREESAIDADAVASALFDDRALTRELVGRVRQDAIAAALPVQGAPGGVPSLVVRLSETPDRGIARRAAALLAADNRRRTGDVAQAALPAEVQHRLVWAVAAALRAMYGDPSFAIDRALVEGAQRVLHAHDESAASEATAMRLAAALDADADAFPGLLLEAVGDGRLTLFVALLAHATGIDYPDMRDVVIDRDGSRLWLVIRALGLDRATIARAGWALSEADPLRDPDAFADMLDAIMSISGASAREAVAPLTLPSDYRAARLRHDRG